MLEQLHEVAKGIWYWTEVCFLGRLPPDPRERVYWTDSLPLLYIGEGIIQQIS